MSAPVNKDLYYIINFISTMTTSHLAIYTLGVAMRKNLRVNELSRSGKETMVRHFDH